MVSTTRPDLAEIVESDVLNTGISDEDQRSLARALAFAADLYGEKLLGTGEPAYEHAVGTARKAAELRLDADARAAALLFAVPAYLPAAEEKLTESFGAAVASLVAGIGRLNELRVVVKTAALGKDSGPQAEVLRKMLLAMVEDVRVVLLRLASRTQTLRWLARAPDAERTQLARETLDIYAPLANRLGVWQLKWELEDLAFRYLEPERYKRIAGMLDDRRSERERFVEQAIGALDDELVDASDWIEQSKHAVLDDSVYVLTPQGKVIDLPQGATPVDFAYALHSDIGHRCRGAKVNGAIVPLDYRLKNAEAVEIITAKTGGPSRDWLNPALGTIKTSRARNKVRQWFNSRDIASVVAAGRAAVERELQREGKRASLEDLARRLGFGEPDQLFAAVGREEVGSRPLQNALRGGTERAHSQEIPPHP